MKFTNEQVINAIVEVTDGTCTYSQPIDGIVGALFNLLAREYGRGWLAASDALQKEAEELAEKYLEAGIESELDEYCFGACFGVCGCCGWIGEMYNGGDLCDDCLEDEEDYE